MQGVFIALLIAVLGYAIFFPRQIDYFTIASISSLLYLYPGIIGKIQLTQGITQKINNSTYLAVCIWLLFLLFAMIICDNYIITIGDKIIIEEGFDEIYTYENEKGNFAVLILDFIEIALCIYAISKYGGLISSMKKVELLAESNKATSYLKYIALFSFVYSFISKGKYSLILRLFGILFIIYTFLLGHRSFAVMGIIGIFAYYVGSIEKKSMLSTIVDHKIIFGLLGLLSVFFFFIKNTYAALFAGNFELVITRLTNPDYYKNALLVSEANTVMRNLQNIIDSNLKYELSNYLLSYITLIPFLGGRFAYYLGYEKFSVDVNMAFNDRFSDGFGIGCTYIGEAYALGWYVGIIIIVFATMLLIAFLNYNIQKTHDAIKFTFLTVAACYYTFFIFRNSQNFLLIMIRAQIYILILLRLLERLKVETKLLN